jgi:hypothetical protein
LGNFFGYKLPDNIDLVFVYESQYKSLLMKFKIELEKLLEEYFIDNMVVTFMDIREFYRRYETGDKFVIILKGK